MFPCRASSLLGRRFRLKPGVFGGDNKPFNRFADLAKAVKEGTARSTQLVVRDDCGQSVLMGGMRAFGSQRQGSLPYRVPRALTDRGGQVRFNMVASWYARYVDGGLANQRRQPYKED